MGEEFGDLKVGFKLEGRGRTVSEGDFAMINNALWLINPLYTDAEYMKTHPLGGRVLAGTALVPLVAGIGRGALGILVQRCGFRQGALLGVSNVRFVTPLHPGDTIKTTIEILEVRRTSKPGRFVLLHRDVATNQDGRVVMEMDRAAMIEKAR